MKFSDGNVHCIRVGRFKIQNLQKRTGSNERIERIVRIIFRDFMTDFGFVPSVDVRWVMLVYHSFVFDGIKFPNGMMVNI